MNNNFAGLCQPRGHCYFKSKGEVWWPWCRKS